MPALKNLLSRGVASVTLAMALCGTLAFGAAGCSSARVTGKGRIRDISKIERGMDPNQVRNIMGANYKLIMEEGLDGMDMGIYIWEYPEGRVHFNQEGVLKVVER